MDTANEKKIDVAQLYRRLENQKRKTYGHWVTLAENYKVEKLKEDPPTRKQFEKVLFYENAILRLLELKGAKVDYNNSTSTFQDLKTLLPRGKRYELYHFHHLTGTLDTGTMAAFNDIHKKINRCLMYIIKLHKKK